MWLLWRWILDVLFYFWQLVLLKVLSKTSAATLQLMEPYFLNRQLVTNIREASLVHKSQDVFHWIPPPPLSTFDCRANKPAFQRLDFFSRPLVSSLGP